MVKKNYGIICDVGGKGKGNQDSAFFTQFDLIIAPGSPDSKEFSSKGILSIVCDGVSASNHGEKGSSFVIRTLSAKIMNHLYTQNFDPGQIQNIIQQFILDTNSELLSLYKDLITSEKVPMTTLVGVLVIGQWLWVFNLGDSPAYLVKDGQIGQITVDHIGTGASHEITEAMGRPTVNPALRLFNWAFENDYTGTNKVYSDSYYFLICSDGLSDLVNPDEIRDHLLSTDIPTLQDKCQALYRLSMERKIEDNVSIIALDLAQYMDGLSPIQIIKLSYE